MDRRLAWLLPGSCGTHGGQRSLSLFIHFDDAPTGQVGQASGFLHQTDQRVHVMRRVRTNLQDDIQSTTHRVRKPHRMSHPATGA